MKPFSLIELIDDENLENALILREKYIENASLPKKAVALRIAKRICAACLAVLFLLVPASALLFEKSAVLPPHMYIPPDNVERKASFREMNDILGSEHLYNRLPEEYSTMLQIVYQHELVYDKHNTSMNYNANLAIGDLIIQNVPIHAKITQEYPDGDILFLSLYLDDREMYTGEIQTEISGITVHLSFHENWQFAYFRYYEHIYSLTLKSENTDITHYLKILLEESQ